ncbi:MAG: acetyl-CoA hydrolase/transferase family protein [Methylocystaceae bacterium]
MSWRDEYRSKITTAEQVAKVVTSGDVIGLGGGTAIPPAITEAIGQRTAELRGIKVCQGFAVALHEYMKPENRDSFHIETIFIGPAERLCIEWGTCDFVPNHLGSMQKWALDAKIKKGFISVTPPDENGYFNRSLFGGLTPTQVINNLDYLAVEVNNHNPWLVSDDFQVHISQVDAIVENNQPLFEVPEIPITPIEESIAHIIADMVNDGDTVQLGLGGLANCVGHFLKDKHHLGIHSEVFSNAIMELMKCGAVDNSRKTWLPGISSYTFAVGTRELYDFVHHNPQVKAFEIGTTNDPNIIAQCDNIISVNNALLIDLTGQVAAEAIGPIQISATGGQVNFVLGSQMAKNGRSIIALPSTYTNHGEIKSRIVDMLPRGTAVSTSRNDVQWIVTEYGAVYLTNKSISERARRLISIAHPDFRDQLQHEAKKLRWL